MTRAAAVSIFRTIGNRHPPTSGGGRGEVCPRSLIQESDPMLPPARRPAADVIPSRARTTRAAIKARAAARGATAAPAPAGLATFEALEGRTLFSVFTVTNTLNAGAGSLRQAITDANAHANV